MLSERAIDDAHNANELWKSTAADFLNRDIDNNGIRIQLLAIMQRLECLDWFISFVCKGLDGMTDSGFLIDKKANGFITKRRFNSSLQGRI